MPNGRRRRENRGFKGGGGSHEHDDRSQPMNIRRVSFKPHSKQNNRQRGWDYKVKAYLQEEDVEMMPQNQGHRKRRDGGDRKNWNQNWGNKGRRQLLESPSYWYKVILRAGHKYERDYLCKVIENFIKPEQFLPVGYKVGSGDASFFIDDHKAAEALLNADRRITLADGWKLSLSVRTVTPLIEVDSNLQTAMKLAMAARYNTYTKALNLANFHRDINFVERSLFCPLNRPNIMTAALQIIGDSTPDLVALDLSDNKINTTDHMKIMIEKVPHLRVLHLGRNKLRDVKMLDALKGLPITEIILDENILCDKFKQKEDYIRAVRDRFPKVIKLDNVELPPPILFVDEEDITSLPPPKASFMSDMQGAVIVRQFLEQYYQIYDSEARDSLVQAYHEEAEFSLTCRFPQGEPNVGSYLAESRNLFKCGNDKRFKLLRKGRESVISVLKALPRSEHDPTSFAVDLVVFSPQVIQINVMGVFRERKKLSIRSFSRVFLLIPVGSGFCIINEMLHVSIPSDDQIRKAFTSGEGVAGASNPVVNNNNNNNAVGGGAMAYHQPPPPIQGSYPSPLASGGVGGAVVAASASPVVASPGASVANPTAALDLPTKQQMVSQLALKTGMNLVWSEKCLVETNWNYDQALYAFSELNKTGTIPPEAFAPI